MAYVLLLIFAIILSSQAQGASVLSTGNCPAGVDFEKSGYIIRLARVESPFQYVSALHAALRNIEAKVADLAGRPYQNREVRKRADELEAVNFLPDAIEQPIRISVVFTSVENCSSGQLDLLYTVFTTQLAPVLSRTFESHQLEKFAPERTAGTDTGINRWRFSPSIAYDRSEQLSGGARLEYRSGNPVSNYLPFGSLMIDGRGSTRMHDLSAAVSGSIVRVSPSRTILSW